ncbi:hypothetical protein KIN20_010775 [Parelaphostrongylus tenuis]|uniref:Uncharacterized protein n=1 Tax=Parelaphostrongylus tenuis TaxID=148309 RepID=A0AAD5QJ15_PARTN|nr:hypothetical protein KIN20_010775 [Parelaphostrongylus tenuis]
MNVIVSDSAMANRDCAGLLLTSSVFVRFPSVHVGVFPIARLRIGAAIGPFLSCELLYAGDPN